MNRVKKIGINTTIWLLTVNDIFTWGVYNVATILIGLYLSERISASATEMVGIGVGIQFFTRAVVEIPFGMYGDRLKEDTDELWLLMLGNLLLGLPVILYTQVTDAWQFYVLQFVVGIGSALNIVDWRKLFAKNLDKGSEGFQYAVYDSIMSLAIAILAIISGTVANISRSYFDLVIGSVGMFIVMSNIWILLIFYVERKQRRQPQAGQNPQY